jgi:hypothetical protein
MNELALECANQVVDPAMHEKILLRAAELLAMGWTRGTAARDATAQKVRSTAPQATRWCLVGAVDRALYELLNLDVYALLGLEVDAYDTAPCPSELLRALRRPLQHVLGGPDLAHWNDHVCPGPAAAERDGGPIVRLVQIVRARPPRARTRGGGPARQRTTGTIRGGRRLLGLDRARRAH